MKKLKKLSILTIMLAMAIFFTGCTNGELGLYNAFLNSQNIKSMESKTDISFKLEGENLSEENQIILDEVSKVLNDYKMTMNQKTVRNEDGTIATSQVDGLVDVGGMKMDLSAWVHADVSKDVPEMKQIIKMPKLIMNMAGEEFVDKEYILYDMDEVVKAAGTEINYDELMTWSKEMEPIITNFLSEYVKNFNSGVKMVESKGTRTMGSQVLNIYELRLSDESFKELVRVTANDFMENEDMKKFMSEYMDMVFSMIETQNPEEAKEMAKEIEELKGEMANFKEPFNEFMDKFDEVKILGEEGIVIEYGINHDDYVITEKASIDLMLDLALLGEEGILKLKIETDTENFNINRNVNIEIPELTEENSLNIMQFLESQL